MSVGEGPARVFALFFVAFFGGEAGRCGPGAVWPWGRVPGPGPL